jgi:hypothetical protein
MNKGIVSFSNYRYSEHILNLFYSNTPEILQSAEFKYLYNRISSGYATLG